MPEPSRPAVDHDADSSSKEPEGGGDLWVVDVFDDLHLEEMVAGAEAADLSEASVPGSLAHLGGVRPGEAAAVLTEEQILFSPETRPNRGPGAVPQHLLELVARCRGARRLPSRRPAARPRRAHP